jgi:hypothetical protein
MKGLEADREFAGLEWIKSLKKDHPIDYEALRGVLYLGFSYLVGEAINQTDALDGTSEKNAVEFMSKLTNLSAMKQALPPHLRNGGIPQDVIISIATRLKDNKYTTADYWKNEFSLNDSAQAKSGTVAGEKFLLRLLLGMQVPAISTGRAKTFAAPEAVPAVSASSGGQLGVQLEYRQISDRPSSAGLAAALKKVIDEVRDVNTKHLGFWERRTLINTADK